MKQEFIIPGLLGAVFGSILMWTIVSNATKTNNTQMLGMMGMRPMMQGTASDTGMMGTIDQHFIEQMIPHHEDAILMANLALQKAKRQEIKTLAQDVVTAQSKEITEMKAWYKEWTGRELPTGEQVMRRHGMIGNASGMHMGMMGNETDINRLEEAADFDKVFIGEMTPHHQMAVMMASMLKTGTTRQEMRQLADDIIAAQTSEIDKMPEWYKTWGY